VFQEVYKLVESDARVVVDIDVGTQQLHLRLAEFDTLSNHARKLLVLDAAASIAILVVQKAQNVGFGPLPSAVGVRGSSQLGTYDVQAGGSGAYFRRVFEFFDEGATGRFRYNGGLAPNAQRVLQQTENEKLCQNNTWDEYKKSLRGDQQTGAHARGRESRDCSRGLGGPVLGHCFACT